MNALLQDFRYAFRTLLKSRGFTALAVIALALGIGANTAIFSVADAFLRKPVAFPHLDRIVMLFNRAPGDTQGWEFASPADYLDWEKQSRSFEQIGAFEWSSFNLTRTGDPEKLQGAAISADLFKMISAKPLLGRVFSAEETEAGRGQETILSYGLWERRFSSDPQIVGKTVTLDGRSFDVVGVMPRDFSFPMSTQIWTPLAMSEDEKAVRDSHHVVSMALLKPGVTIAQAQAEMDILQKRAETNFPKTETGWSVWIMPLRLYAAGLLSVEYSLVLLGAVGFVLLIACANVANLLLARSVGRQKEIAVRRALGASRWRIIRQLLAESLLLAFAGAGIGLLIGEWGIELIVKNMPPEVARYIPAWSSIKLDRDTFIYTMAMTVIVGILAGLAPALQGSRPDLVESLKETGRGTTGGRARQRMRSAFVVAEIALSLVLLVGAVLMVKGVNAIFRMNFNFEPQSVLTMRMTLPESKYKDSAQQAAFYDRMLQSVGSLAGVKEAALASVVPFGIGGASDDFSIEGQPARPGEYRTANRETISPAYFRLLHVALRQGREFTNADAADRPGVAIISESLARRFWPGGSALGRHIKMGRDDEPGPWLTIAGVVSDVTYQIFDRNPPYAIYLSYRQQSYADTYLVVRTTSDPRGMIPAIRGSVASVDPDQPVYDAMTLERVISNAIVGLSYVAANMGILGLIALVLASVGVYGVMAYAVTERMHEIGVRLALGARPKDVMRMLISRGLVLTAIGIAIGLPLTFALARLLASLLFGVSATDLISFGGGAAALAGVALLACYFPARRAMRVDPMVALRYE